MKSITFVSQSTEIDQALDDPPESADASEYCCREFAFYRQESNFLYRLTLVRFIAQLAKRTRVTSACVRK